MKKIILAAALALASVQGAAATEQVSVRETVKLAEPAAKVWSRIGHFSDLNWHPAIKSTEASDGDNPLSQRRLDLGGVILWEALIASDPSAHSYRYRILDNGSNQKIVPVSHYVSTIEVQADGAGSEVIWSAQFEPAAGSTPEASKQAVSGIYRAGLDALAK